MSLSNLLIINQYDQLFPSWYLFLSNIRIMAEFTYLLMFVFQPFNPMNELRNLLINHNFLDNLEETVKMRIDETMDLAY